MALEACFQLTPTSSSTRACALYHSQREKKLNLLLPNKEPKRLLSSAPSSSISFLWTGRHTARRANLICQAKNAVDEVLEVTDESWNEHIIESTIPVLVKFWAPSCGPCKLIEPLVVEVAKEYAGKIQCYKINTDASLRMASKYGIRDIPTLLLFKDGEKKESVTGAVRKSALCATIDKYLEL